MKYLRSWLNRNQTKSARLQCYSLEERCVPATVLATSPTYTLALAPTGVPTTFPALFSPQPSPDGLSSFLKGLYNGVLGRAPDTAGYDYWLTQLENGLPRQYVAYQFINSTEARTNQVEGYYEEFLGRAADPAGLTSLVADLQQGVGESVVVSAFLTSPEFAAKNDNDSFVNILYETLLGRAADASGFANWTSLLANGFYTRAQEVNAFIQSPEGLQAVIDADYSSYLERQPYPGELNYASWQLQSGYLTYGQFQASILSSHEFFGDAISNE